jgi:hypothetical protein
MQSQASSNLRWQNGQGEIEKMLENFAQTSLCKFPKGNGDRFKNGH